MYKQKKNEKTKNLKWSSELATNRKQKPNKKDYQRYKAAAPPWTLYLSAVWS